MVLAADSAGQGDREDRRVKRTNKLLQEALIALTLEKGFDAVTIREITERADVGYATFFRHYPDKEALLAAVIQSMRDDFQELLAPPTMVSDPETTARLVFEYVKQNSNLCRVLFDSSDTMSLIRPVQAVGLQEVDSIFANTQGARVPVEIAINHLMSSLVMLLRWWLDNNLPYSPERMGQIAAELIIRPVIASMEGQVLTEDA
jgi:AcrR family transcriptional regulator